MTKMGRALFASTLLGLCIGLMYAPQIGVAGPEHCPRGPNCTCFYPSKTMCVQQLRINNPKFVHLKVWVLGNSNGSLWQIRQDRSQQKEGTDGQQTYVKRSPDDPVTHFSVQRCENTFVGSTSCDGWQQVYLLEPSVGQLEACNSYADKAAAAAKDNTKLKCGYEGERWTSDRKAHFNFCAANPASDNIKIETNARKNDLQACTAKVAAANAPLPPPPPPKNYTGTWDVTLSGAPFTLVLRQQGPAISGQLVNADPQLNGTLQGSVESDGRAKFSYVQPQLNTGGSGRLWLTETVDKLTGRFSFNGEQALRLLEGCRNSCQGK